MIARCTFFVALLATSSLALAQAAPPLPAPVADGVPAPADTQRAEHLHVEDAGSRVDEQRYGGETRHISVQSKSAAVPAYQVQPHAPYSRESGPGQTGPRTWTIVNF